MLSALHVKTSEQIVLLEEDGRERAEELRALAWEGFLVCEVFKAPVVVRAGEERLWHFAHKARANCPKAQESLEVVESRLLLYRLLSQKFEGQVRLEKWIDDPRLPRPIDLWLEPGDGRRFAWWIVSSQLKPDVRADLTAGFKALNACPHYIFTARMLSGDPTCSGILSLSTTERELMHQSKYGAAGDKTAPSLHFLEPQSGILTTFRALEPVHPPSGYRGVHLERPLLELLISPRTGELVHPGEPERWKEATEAERKRKEEEARREKKKRELEARLEAELATLKQRLEEDAQKAKAAEAQRRAAFQRECDEEAEQRRAADKRRKEAESIQPSPAPSSPVNDVLGGVEPPREDWRPPWMGQAAGAPRGVSTAPSALASVTQPEARCEGCGATTRDWVAFYGATRTCICRACNDKERGK